MLKLRPTQDAWLVVAALVECDEKILMPIFAFQHHDTATGFN